MRPSKYYGIDYPIFCLNKLPYGIRYLTDSIQVKLTEFKEYKTIDVYEEGKTVLNRYLQSGIDFCFDVTCFDLTNLIRSKPEWGIDSSANLHKFVPRETFKARCVKVKKSLGNAIWVDTVSYPFELKQTQMLSYTKLKRQWLVIVYIDKRWQPYKFLDFYRKVNYVRL